MKIYNKEYYINWKNWNKIEEKYICTNNCLELTISILTVIILDSRCNTTKKEEKTMADFILRFLNWLRSFFTKHSPEEKTLIAKQKELEKKVLEFDKDKKKVKKNESLKNNVDYFNKDK